MNNKKIVRMMKNEKKVLLNYYYYCKGVPAKVERERERNWNGNAISKVDKMKFMLKINLENFQILPESAIHLNLLRRKFLVIIYFL